MAVSSPLSQANADEGEAAPNAALPSSSASGEQGAKKKPKGPDRSFKYVIVGGGVAGYHAMITLRQHDPEATILVVGEEHHQPYERPPLTTELWASPDPEVDRNLRFVSWAGEEISVYLAEDPDFVEPTTFLEGRQVIGLHPGQRAIIPDEDYEVINYEKLLLATGAEPKVLDQIDDAVLSHVSTYREIEDFQLLHRLTRDRQEPVRVAVVGGSFLGTELVTALHQRSGVQVTQVTSGAGPLSNILPGYLAEEVKRRLSAKGIQIVSDDRAVSLTLPTGSETEAATKGVQINLQNGSPLVADHVVLAIGVSPRVDLAIDAKLEVDAKNGIAVGSQFQTSLSDIYAAGDVASYYDMNMSRRRVVPHFDHASISGQSAAMNMIGAKSVPYAYEPFYWVTLPDGLGLHGVGITDPSLETVSVWREPADPEQPKKFDVGIVYYLEPVSATRKRIVGVLLWNLAERIHSARKVLTLSQSQITNPEDCIRKIALFPPEPIPEDEEQDETPQQSSETVQN